MGNTWKMSHAEENEVCMYRGQNISLLIDVTNIGKQSHAKAVLVNMLRGAWYKVGSCLMTLKR